MVYGAYCAHGSGVDVGGRVGVGILVGALVGTNVGGIVAVAGIGTVGGIALARAVGCAVLIAAGWS